MSYFSLQRMDLEKHSLSPLAKAGDHESEHEEDVLVFAALKKWLTSTAEQMRTARENSTEAVAIRIKRLCSNRTARSHAKYMATVSKNNYPCGS